MGIVWIEHILNLSWLPFVLLIRDRFPVCQLPCLLSEVADLFHGRFPLQKFE
jgi:hypothetical protein